MKSHLIAPIHLCLIFVSSSCTLHRTESALATREPSPIQCVDLCELEADLSSATILLNEPSAPSPEPDLAPSEKQSAQAVPPESKRSAMRIGRSRLAEANLERRFRPVRTTAYHHNEADHKKYGNQSAAGTNLSYGWMRSAAADWSRFPLGTVFRIVGQFDTCEYVIDDYGIALVGTDTIDLYKPNASEMNAWGARDVVIEVLEWGSYEDSLRIMNGRKRWKHVRKMVEGIEQTLAQTEDEPDGTAGNHKFAMLEEFYGDDEATTE